MRQGFGATAGDWAPLVKTPPAFDGRPFDLACRRALLSLREPVLTRRRGGRALIGAVAAAAKKAGAANVFWNTHQTNAAARGLYDDVA